ncbi:hypothetical protein [Pseudomonas aeruginosa]|uniref:hypothetical protein n=1 Tax=Pseudomonas aeruginosa TaxID=287 RepID=UPI002E280441|nr:hypothetical protein [Pseudomonas aeruginosa]
MVAAVAGSSYADGSFTHRRVWFSYRDDRIYPTEVDPPADIPIVDVIEIPLEPLSVSMHNMQTKMDFFVTVTLPILVAIFGVAGGGWAMYSHLDDRLESQRTEIKGDFDGLSSQMNNQIEVMGQVRAEVGKLSGEIVKAKGELIQEMSQIRMRQVVAEQGGKPIATK